MKFEDFSADPAVQSFVDWMRAATESLPIEFRIAPSRFVPGGIHESIEGFPEILKRYKWRTVEAQVGDWAETKSKLSRFKSEPSRVCKEWR